MAAAWAWRSALPGPANGTRNASGGAATTGADPDGDEPGCVGTAGPPGIDGAPDVEPPTEGDGAPDAPGAAASFLARQL